MVYPKINPVIGTSPSQANFIDPANIKPLILEKVIVKAKKLVCKEKEASDHNEESAIVEDL